MNATSALSNTIAELSLPYHMAHDMLHVISARRVARALHTVGPWALQRYGWRQFEEERGDCETSNCPFHSHRYQFYHFVNMKSPIPVPIRSSTSEPEQSHDFSAFKHARRGDIFSLVSNTCCTVWYVTQHVASDKRSMCCTRLARDCARAT